MCRCTHTHMYIHTNTRTHAYIRTHTFGSRMRSSMILSIAYAHRRAYVLVVCVYLSCVCTQTLPRQFSIARVYFPFTPIRGSVCVRVCPCVSVCVCVCAKRLVTEVLETPLIKAWAFEMQEWQNAAMATRQHQVAEQQEQQCLQQQEQYDQQTYPDETTQGGGGGGGG
eukprot:GHVU01113592.1.p1 GENE.GHVU01113592.1~~GHVU01113592.1.p1  ORF type:complete len:168 (-),score=18.95 GHVU01113592.1:22-525(-)